MTFFDMHSASRSANRSSRTRAEEGGVHDFAFSPDGKTLAFPGGPGINFLDVKTHEFADDTAIDAGATGFEYLSAIAGIVSAGDGTVSLWDLKKRKRIQPGRDR